MFVRPWGSISGKLWNSLSRKGGQYFILTVEVPHSVKRVHGIIMHEGTIDEGIEEGYAAMGAE